MTLGQDGCIEGGGMKGSVHGMVRGSSGEVTTYTC